MPISAILTASAKNGTCRACSRADSLLAESTSFRCPISPNPVMSVAVLTPTRVMISAARLSSGKSLHECAELIDIDCFAFEADVTKGATLAAAIAAAHKRWGKIDILHYNVGVSLGGVQGGLSGIEFLFHASRLAADQQQRSVSPPQRRPCIQHRRRQRP